MSDFDYNRLTLGDICTIFDESIDYLTNKERGPLEQTNIDFPDARDECRSVCTGRRQRVSDAQEIVFRHCGGGTRPLSRLQNPWNVFKRGAQCLRCVFGGFWHQTLRNVFQRVRRHQEVVYHR